METNFPTKEQIDAFGRFLNSLVTALPRVALLVALILAGIFLLRIITILILHLLHIRRVFSQKSVVLELIPHALTDKTPLANRKLFNELHGLELVRTLANKLLLHEIAFSLELVGTRQEGIRYIARVAENYLEDFKRVMAAYATTIQFRQIEDYLPSKARLASAKFLEFRQTKYFAYPLAIDESFEENDMEASLTGMMTKLEQGELMALQLVLKPTTTPNADEEARKVLHSESPIHQLGRQRRPVLQLVLAGFGKLLFGITGLVGEMFHGPSQYTSRVYQQDMQHYHQVAKGVKPARTLSPIEQRLADLVYDKASQSHFKTNIRALILMNSAQRTNERANSVRKALSVFDMPRYQQLRTVADIPLKFVARYRQFIFRYRLPDIFNDRRCILAASELGGIYHFPHSVTARVEGVVKSQSRTLPAPPIIKKRADEGSFDVMLGLNHHLGSVTPIGLVAKEREKHLFVIGGTGNGKTTLMLYMILQDIWNGKGVAVIDPHGDLAKTLLKYIPEERVKDVVYLNPVDIKYPIGLNLLELPTGLDEDDLLLEKGRVASAVVSVMRKVFSDDEANAHRIEAVMRNAIHTALTVESATLFTVLKLLRNDTFRKDVVSKLEDEDLKDFWKGEIGQAGDMQLVSMTKGVTQRIDRFNTSAPAKRMLGQAKSTISFEDIMDSGKILICNFSTGDIEEDESALFGTTVLAKLKMAAERRSRIPESERRPFYLYVDEFQNFATTPFVKMLSSSRKYKLFLTIAEQSTKQQEDDRMTEAILSNVSTVVCFRTGSHDDEELMLHRFEPYLQKGEISNLPAYNFYVRIQAQESLEPMSGETVVVSEGEASEARSDEVIKASRDAYAIKYVKPPKVKAERKKGNSKPRRGSARSQQGAEPLMSNDDA